jgi:hypothetical protein
MKRYWGRKTAVKGEQKTTYYVEHVPDSIGEQL